MKFGWYLCLSLLLSACGGAAKTKYLVNPGDSNLSYEQFHFSQAVRVDDTVWVSGQVGFDGQRWGTNIEEQTQMAFSYLEKVLKASGADMADVVELTTFHTNVADIGTVAQVKDRYFPNNYPAWHVLGVSALVFPEAQIEIKAVAVVGSGLKVVRVQNGLNK